MNRCAPLAAVCLTLLIAAGISGCSKKEPPAQAEAKGVPVSAGKAVSREMPVEIRSVGTVEAFRSVTVVSQAAGQIRETHFREGQDVRKGDLLFTIDPAAYEEGLRQAEAKLAREAAQLKQDQAEAERYAFLVEKGAVSRAEYEKARTTAATQAEVVKDHGAGVEQAKLKLRYCAVRAPVDGRTGGFLVNRGTVVKENDTQLVVINELRPVHVRFSLPETRLSEIKALLARGTLSVRANPPGHTGTARTGKLVFIDNSVDTDTGMIRLKALFPNDDAFFWPGQFLAVALRLALQKDAVVVPSEAVQLSQESRYVFVVKPDLTVTYRPVQVDRVSGAETVLAKGVAPGEIVVIDGHLKLKEGFKVEIRKDAK